MDYHHRHPGMEQGGQGQGAWAGYAGGWGAPAPRAAKRVHSDSDDDAFSEESSSKDATCSSPGGGGGGGGGDSCQLLTRKRRRGVIEKKRRDRINTSLTELKRLVPSAYEKQGSAKLEKAEILQLTVDHLKMLHAKGLDTFAYDPQRYAMDYHSIGFRECASEVARYLVSCEGLDIQDPLRLRLMSHLQCFAAQRDLAAKSCASPWSYPGAPLNHLPPAAPVSNPVPAPNLIGHIPAHHPHATHAMHDAGHSYTDISNSCPPPARLEQPVAASASQALPAPSTSAASLAPLGSLASTSAAYPAPAPHYPAGYPQLAPAYHHPPPAGHHQYNQSNSKPYRPWGAELAY